MEMIRAAVAGIGGIGKQHGGMMRDTGKIEVVALCDANAAAADIASRDFPGTPFYTSLEEMLAKERVDLLTIATPHNLHAPLAIQALQAGVNVIVEKPMATRYEDAVAMINAAKKSGKMLTVYHNRRLDGWFLAARNAIQAGLIGDIFEINSGIGYRAKSKTWRGNKEASGGVMFDWGAHLVDYALHFETSVIKAVSGWFYRRPDDDPASNHDHGTLRVYFESGAVANITISACEYIPGPRYRILGTKGTLVDNWNWDESKTMQIVSHLAGGERVATEVSYQKTEHAKYYQNIIDHLQNGAPLLAPAESAAKVINVLTTAERSYEQGGAPLPLA